jgi:hypothetical protein
MQLMKMKHLLRVLDTQLTGTVEGRQEKKTLTSNTNEPLRSPLLLLLPPFTSNTGLVVINIKALFCIKSA